jgi:FMN reductase
MTYPINIHANVVNAEVDWPVGALLVDGSPTGGGKTQAALELVGGALGVAKLVSLSEPDGIDRALDALDDVPTVVFGAPVYRAAAAAPLKQFLDLISRDREGQSPLAAKPVAIVLTGASLHHFLALDGLRNVLAGFFAAHVPREAWAEDGRLEEPFATQAAVQGRALAELAQLVVPGSALSSVRPQA